MLHHNLRFLQLKKIENPVADIGDIFKKAWFYSKRKIEFWKNISNKNIKNTFLRNLFLLGNDKLNRKLNAYVRSIFSDPILSNMISTSLRLHVYNFFNMNWFVNLAVLDLCCSLKKNWWLYIRYASRFDQKSVNYLHSFSVTFILSTMVLILINFI